MPGPFPGLVTAVEHPGSIVNGAYQAEPVRKMMEKGLTALTGAPGWTEAWRYFFEKGDVVAIKVNMFVTTPGYHTDLELLIQAARLFRDHGARPVIVERLEVIDQVVDPCGKPIRVDLHRRKLRPKCRQALAEGLAQMFEARAVEMCSGPGHRGAAKTQRDRGRTEVEQWQHDLQHRPEAGSVVGQLQTGLNLAILQDHRCRSVGAHPEAIPGAGDRQPGRGAGEEVKGGIGRAAPIRSQG